MNTREFRKAKTNYALLLVTFVIVSTVLLVVTARTHDTKGKHVSYVDTAMSTDSSFSVGFETGVKVASLLNLSSDRSEEDVHRQCEATIAQVKEVWTTYLDTAPEDLLYIHSNALQWNSTVIGKTIGESKVLSSVRGCSDMPEFLRTWIKGQLTKYENKEKEAQEK